MRINVDDVEQMQWLLDETEGAAARSGHASVGAKERTKSGWEFGYTTKRLPCGKFAAFIWRPSGGMARA